MTFRPYVPIGGVIGGALAGLGIFVLMQQFAVVAPTRGAVVGGVGGGALAMLVMSNLVRAVAARRSVPTRAPAAAAASTNLAPRFSPTHRTPTAGAEAYESPGATAVTRLDPGLEVEVLQRSGDWAQVRCSNGWTTWVDGRLLVGS